MIKSGVSTKRNHSFLIKLLIGAPFLVAYFLFFNVVQAQTIVLFGNNSSGGGGGGYPVGFFDPPAKPEGGFFISINNGATTTASNLVTLNIGSGPDTGLMKISNSEDFANSFTEDFEDGAVWDICKTFNVCEDGEYIVYAKLYNVFGQIPSKVLSGKIILDRAAREAAVGEVSKLAENPIEVLEELVNRILKRIQPIAKRRLKTIQPPKESFLRELGAGDVGSDVFVLQKFLNDSNLTIGGSGPGSAGFETRRFGSATRKSLVIFQTKYISEIIESSPVRNHSTLNFGELDVLTRSYINSLFKKDVDKIRFVRPLKTGKATNDVINLQQILRLDRKIYPEALITGVFDEATENAVKRFQLKYGLIFDVNHPAYGYVGPGTRSMLNQIALSQKKEKVIEELGQDTDTSMPVKEGEQSVLQE